MNKFKIIIADDHEIFRNGLKLILKEIHNIELLAEAKDGEELIKLIDIYRSNLPDIIFMDIQMPKINGIEATKIITNSYTNINIIALTMHEEEEYLDSMLQAGAKGFLIKRVSKMEIEKAINYVIEGKNYYSEDLMSLITQKLIGKTSTKNNIINSLSEREIEVLQLVCAGYSNVEIGEKLFLSHRTIEKHRANLIEKTGVKNTIELIMFAIKNKVVKL